MIVNKLKEEYRPNWTAIGYIEKRKKLAKSLKECEYSRDEIKKKARIRREKRQKEVLDSTTCQAFQEADLCHQHA